MGLLPEYKMHARWHICQRVARLQEYRYLHMPGTYCPLNVCQWARWVSHGLPSACDNPITHSNLLSRVIIGIVEIVVNITSFVWKSLKLLGIKRLGRDCSL